MLLLMMMMMMMMMMTSATPTTTTTIEVPFRRCAQEEESDCHPFAMTQDLLTVPLPGREDDASPPSFSLVDARLACARHPLKIDVERCASQTHAFVERQLNHLQRRGDASLPDNFEGRLFREASALEKTYVALDAIARRSGTNYVEGGTFKFLAEDTTEVAESLRLKRATLLRLFAAVAPGHRLLNVAEIGFNCGHSSATFLHALGGGLGGGVTVTSFDIGVWPYVRPAFEHLRAKFGPGRIELVVGDSEETLPKFTWHEDLPLLQREQLLREHQQEQEQEQEAAAAKDDADDDDEDDDDEDDLYKDEYDTTMYNACVEVCLTQNFNFYDLDEDLEEGYDYVIDNEDEDEDEADENDDEENPPPPPPPRLKRAAWGFDAVFIDGGHFYEQAFGDIRNMANLSKPGALVVVDDCEMDEGFYEAQVAAAAAAAAAGGEPNGGFLLGTTQPYAGSVSQAWRHAVERGLVGEMPRVFDRAGLCYGHYLPGRLG